ncbi:MAG TPA: hypothetical protein VGE52_07645, partial [Pirellulales bacterium]
KLKTFAAWELVFSDEPRDWERLVCERIDPRYRRTAWIDALATGYFLLRESGEKGRLTRRAAEKAAGWSDGPWVDLQSDAAAHKDATAAHKSSPLIGKLPSTDEIAHAVVEAVSASGALAAAATAKPAEQAKPVDPNAITVVMQKAESGLKLDRIETPDPAVPVPAPVDLLKSFWESASIEDRERFAAWMAAQTVRSA